MTTKVTVTCMYAQRPRPTSTAVSTPVAATAPRYGRHAPGWNASGGSFQKSSASRASTHFAAAKMRSIVNGCGKRRARSISLFDTTALIDTAYHATITAAASRISRRPHGLCSSYRFGSAMRSSSSSSSSNSGLESSSSSASSSS